jgi:cytochrome c oxidase cbb3-type subunit 1
MEVQRPIMTAKLRPYDEPPRRRLTLIPRGPNTAASLFLAAAVFWFFVATAIGALWAVLQLVPTSFGASIPLPFGIQLEIVFNQARVLSGFENTLVYGWLTNAGIAALFFIGPRLVGRQLEFRGFAFLAWLIWNFATVAGGLALIYTNFIQTGPLAEYPFLVDGAALSALALVNLSFWATVLPRRGGTTDALLYPSTWYLGVGLLAFTGIYGLASLPSYAIWIYPGIGEANAALITAFSANAIESYWLLGAAVGVLYYVVPRAANAQLYSLGLAAVGFVLWLPLAGLYGVAALIDPAVPYVITTLGTVGAFLLIVHAFLVAANLLRTLSGRWALALGRGAIPFALVAITFLVGTAVLQGAGALRSVQVLTGPTVWSVGALVVTAGGAYTFAQLAFTDYALPRVLHRAWRPGMLNSILLWATLGGALIGGLALMFGGIAQGSMITQAAAPEAISQTLMVFMVVAAGGLGLAALGGATLLAIAFVMFTSGRYAERAIPAGAAAAAAGH